MYSLLPRNEQRNGFGSALLIENRQHSRALPINKEAPLEALTLLFLQLGKVHAQAFLPDLALELYLHKLGILLHLAFQDDAPTEYVMPYRIARLVLLPFEPGGVLTVSPMPRMLRPWRSHR